MCKKYHLRGGFAAAHPILLPQLSKSELLPLLLPLLLPTLLLLKPLLPLLLPLRLRRLLLTVSEQAPLVSGQAPPVSEQAPPLPLPESFPAKTVDHRGR